MKTSTLSHYNRTAIVVLALAVLSTGCTASRAVRSVPAESGFPGDSSGLQKNPDFPSALVYVKPGVQWGKYSAIELESAGLYLTDTSTAPSPEDQTLLAGMLYNTMTAELGKSFELVTTPAPSALRVRTAWSQIPSAKGRPLVPTFHYGPIAIAIPQLRITTDVRDSVSGERLAAGVDARTETQAPIGRSSYERWGDNVQAPIDYWSKRYAWQLWRLARRTAQARRNAA